MRAHRGALWCSAAALGAAASDATLWTVSTRGFETTCKAPELDAALARAASVKATLTATAPAHITTGADGLPDLKKLAVSLMSLREACENKTS